MNMKLQEIKEMRGTITLKSGLHIGAGDTEMKIGGTDNPVVKHSITQEPYIPGSSIKGKVRSLLELRSGLMKKTGGKPLAWKTLKECSQDEKRDGGNIIKLFGTSASDEDESSVNGPTRVSFADCMLTSEWREEAFRKQWALTEVKSENSINRIKGVAENPRFTERVVEGACFDFCVTLKVFKDDEELEELLLTGLKLLTMDALGGSGSRGYGKIELDFENPKINSKFRTLTPL
jgi:CRISPR-associated protein Csm3